MSNSNEFVVENGVLKRYKGEGGDIVIPEGVTKIQWYTFPDNITSVTIPDTLESIDNGAFSNGGKSLADPDGFCRVGRFLINYIGNAENLFIPEGITDILSVESSSVKKIHLPSTIKMIGSYSFRNCPNLEEVIFAALSPDFQLIGCNAFSHCPNLASINIPDSVRSVEWGAFDNCQKLFDNNDLQIVGPVFCHAAKDVTDVIVPDGVKVIAANAFRWTSVQRVILPNGLRTIDEEAFASTQLQSVVLPDGLSILGKDAFSSSKLSSIVIPGSVGVIHEKAFYGCDNLTSVTILSGVTAIDKSAFSGCNKLASIEIPDSVTTIGENVFHNCRELKQVRIPNSVTSIDRGAFSYTGLTNKSIVLPEQLVNADPDIFFTIGIPDENYCLIKDNVLVANRAPRSSWLFSSKSSDSNTLVVTDGVVEIGENALSGAETVHLPDSVRIIQYSDDLKFKKINLPQGYLCQTDKLPAKALMALLERPWKDVVTLEDIVAVYLCQKGKDLTPYCEDLLTSKWDSGDSAKALLQFLKDHGSGARIQTVAEFIWNNRKEIPQDTINAFYQYAVEKKATKAIGLVKSIAVFDSASTEKPTKKTKKGETNVNPIEAFCNENYKEQLLDKVCKGADIPKTAFAGVLYRDSDAKVPPFVVKCAVLPYVEQLTEKPKHIGDYKTAFSDFEMLEESDKVAQTFDPDSFVAMLEKLANIKDAYKKPQRLIPLCRFGTGKQINDVIAAMNKWSDWNKYATSGRTAIIVARGALLLSDTREAMLYAEKNKILRVYALMRDMDTETLRDNVLANFGLDENGKKSLDIGNTTIEVSMNADLTLSLYDTEAGKTVKSIPKKGSDPQKYDQASAELADMKKNLKKVTKSRNDILFDQFLHGGKRKADSWQQSYLKNPVLHKIAELIVWCQKKDTFTLTTDGIIDCNGNPYTIQDNVDITVAHPISMKPEEIRAWQNYYTSKQLKQPFEQVWEPVYDPKAIMPNRYKGIKIPYYRFLKQPTIHVTDYDFHNDITISFDGCDAQIKRLDWARHQIDMNDNFEVEEIQYGRRSRTGNHTIAYLDKITTMGRIADDDITIGDSLSRFTIAQITTFISKAQEVKANNVLAILLDYKNKTFGTTNPMDEFTLDW